MEIKCLAFSAAHKKIQYAKQRVPFQQVSRLKVCKKETSPNPVTRRGSQDALLWRCAAWDVSPVGVRRAVAVVTYYFRCDSAVQRVNSRRTLHAVPIVKLDMSGPVRDSCVADGKILMNSGSVPGNKDQPPIRILHRHRHRLMHTRTHNSNQLPMNRFITDLTQP